MKENQPELFNEATPSIEHHVNWLIGQLALAGIEASESRKRRIRLLADLSHGQIAGGQGGYKLVKDMTETEYQHWRNVMLSQSNEMRRRVVEADKHRYPRQSVNPKIL